MPGQFMTICDLANETIDDRLSRQYTIVKDLAVVTAKYPTMLDRGILS